MAHHPFGEILGSHEKFSKNVEAHCAYINKAQAEPAAGLEFGLDVQSAEAELQRRSDESKRAVDESQAKLAKAKAEEKQWLYVFRGMAINVILVMLAGLVFGKYKHVTDRDFYTTALYGILLSSAFTALTFERVSLAYYHFFNRLIYKGKHQALVGTSIGIAFLAILIGFALLVIFLGGRLVAL